MNEEAKLIFRRQDEVHPILNEGVLVDVFGDVDGSAVDSVSIMGPRDYWGFCRYRERVVPPGDRELASPADVFLWAEGIQAPASVSRLGGVPYMSRETPWPVRNGVASEFWCQLSFADSRSLVPDTPGDLLFVFRNPGVPEDLDGAFEFRWGGGVVNTAWTMADVPDGSCRMESLTGVRVRCEDYLCGGDAGIVPAVKIGGYALDLQEVGPVDPPRGTRFIAQLVSLLVRPCVLHPLIGRREPVARNAESLRKYGYCGSGLSIGIFVSEGGDVIGRTTYT